jgi:hypothetical protein
LPGAPAAATIPADDAQSWERTRAQSVGPPVRGSGWSLDGWKAQIAGIGFDGEASPRRWLQGQDVIGHAQALLVWETFGYPDFLTASSDELAEAQYRDRAALRPILDAVLGLVPELEGTAMEARKGFVTLVARRTYAVVRPTTRTRVDLELRLPDTVPTGRLQAPGAGLRSATARIALPSPADVDAEVVEWLRKGNAANR